MSTCFKCNVKDVEVVRQVKAWYELESYGTHKQADALSAADQRAHNFLDKTTYHDGERYCITTQRWYSSRPSKTGRQRSGLKINSLTQ